MRISLRRMLAGVAIALIGCTVASIPAFAERRVALVIGNSAYRNTVQLPNPRNDATDVARMLKSAGFEVVEGVDLDKRGMDDAFRRFADAAVGADAALFFYGGHGFQFQGTNYLVPVDAKLAGATDIGAQMARVDDILADLQRASGVRILMLDACRDNPLADQLLAQVNPARAVTITRGLARIKQTAGTVIAYSTQPGAVAADGEGRNSPFAAAFIREVGQPGVEIGPLFRHVAADVYKATSERQLPEVTFSLLGDFYFTGQPVAAPPPVATAPSTTQTVSLALPTPAARSAAEGCDKLAASAEDIDRPSGVPGVALNRIQPRLAVDACRAALAQAPDHRRLQFQISRALSVAGENAEARDWLTKSAAAGSVAAMSDLAVMLEKGEGGPADLPRAVALFDQAAAAGNVPAMRNVAIEFENGLGRPADAAQAAQWYRKAADTGDPQAMGFLAVLYLQGTGVPKDASQARAWIDRLVTTEHTATMLRVGYVLLGLTGAVKDYATARKLFLRAAELGDGDGNVMLGNMAAGGIGEPRDFARAADFYERAAAIGNLNAKASLIPLLMVGVGGVRRDPGKAAEYGLEALRGGSPVARGLLIEKPTTSLTPELRKAIEQRLARAGLLKRAPDGRYGPDTLAALQSAVLAR
ncbi:caspase family protein [Bradyrhizobium genosp. L]|uniref:caspase family protein n=1 Tax=Bradyrhizobium genosp. L TaxID=83637 RepID=UPI0018A33546|nr:caspase family protein [Bradyrhizobium genosp. L]QPF87915.1 caspase family protein [Bradyrhizobium genosp. L]